MLTVSLHGIRISALYGLYAEESLLANEFEVDVDLFLQVADGQPWPFADYTLVNEIVLGSFQQTEQTLETAVQHIHSTIKARISFVDKARITIRKLHPPMAGNMRYAQVSYEA